MKLENIVVFLANTICKGMKYSIVALKQPKLATFKMAPQFF